jgi:hypothetical protein
MTVTADLARLQVEDLGVSFRAGFAPAPVQGPCDHSCGHTRIRIIASGPDDDHANLLRCELCFCRAWCRDIEKLSQKTIVGSRWLRVEEV